MTLFFAPFFFSLREILCWFNLHSWKSQQVSFCQSDSIISHSLVIIINGARLRLIGLQRCTRPGCSANHSRTLIMTVLLPAGCRSVKVSHLAPVITVSNSFCLFSHLNIQVSRSIYSILPDSQPAFLIIFLKIKWNWNSYTVGLQKDWGSRTLVSWLVVKLKFRVSVGKLQNV